MNKMQTITRIVLAAIALYIILEVAKYILSGLLFFGQGGGLPLVSLLMSFVVIASMIILAVIIGRELIVRGEKWACRIVAHSQESEAEKKTNWQTTTYHIISISLGILFVWWTVPAFFNLVSSFLLSLNAEYKNWYPHPKLLIQLISVIVRLIIAAYLLFGAPHFVRWQVKKTLELCEEFGGSEEAGESKQNQ